jgi:DNA-binding transcriptional LysR family regulator
MDDKKKIDASFARKVDWNLFQLFHEIVRAGGIGAAARRLNRQQPTVSAALKRLEDHLGVTLLKRTASGIELLPAGRALFDLCETMMGAVRAAPHDVAVAAGLVEGVINIRMISSVVSAEFDAALAGLHRHHPGVGIHIDVVPWRQVIEGLKSGEAEVGIACDNAPDAALCYQPLMKEVQQLYCHKAHALYGMTVPQPSDLAAESFIATGLDEPQELANFRTRYGLGARIGGYAENLHETKRLIEHDGALWPLLPEAVLPAYQVYLVTRDEPARNTPTELFLAEIMGKLRQPGRDT